MNQTYAAWADYHSSAFGLKFEGQSEMVALWVEAFRSAGFTAAELFEASRWMLTESAPKRPSEHLAMIQDRVHRQRNNVFQKASAYSGRASLCIICDDVGLVVVPHECCFGGGEWRAPYATMAVSCMCQRGEKAARDATEREAPMKTLRQYEFVFQNWQEQMQRREEIRHAFLKAHNHTRYMDDAFSSVLKRIKTPEQHAAKRVA